MTTPLDKTSSGAKSDEYLVEVHVLIKAGSHASAEAKVTNAIRGFARSMAGVNNVYIADVRHEDDNEDEDAAYQRGLDDEGL